MDTQQLRPLLERFHSERDAAAEALIGGCFTGKRADRALAACADDQGAAERVE